MKLSTLLLSSAALVVAGSAYAADLPAKKAAPAAKAATGCPAFGAGYFSIPGGDTCLKIFGYARGTYSVSSGTNTTNSMKGEAALGVDVKGNSDVGVIQSKAAFNSTLSGIDYAYVNVSGITAGKKGSITDFDQSGIGYQIGGSYTPNTINYSTALGSSTLTIGLEENRANGTAGSSTQYRPDLVAALNTKVGPAGFDIAVASTAPRVSSATGAEGQGYGVTGDVSVAAGPASIALYGAYAYGASALAAVSAVTDYDGTNYSKVTAFGLKGSVGVGSAGTLTAFGGQENKTPASGSLTTNSYYALNYAHKVGSGLTVATEFLSSTSASVTTNTGYLRIQRDF